MKKIILFLIFIMVPAFAQAAINASANWELRGNGGDTNGGAFALGVTSKSSASNLVVDASNNSQVTSASYSFTSADVGRWVQVTAGAGWTVGYYKITSVVGSAAILNLSPAPVTTTGGQFSIYWGLDYSQQNAANVNGGNDGSSVLAVTTGTSTLTCSDCLFTNDIIGNVVYISGGTGSIAAQRRSIISYTNATTVGLDTTVASSTGMTINIGGSVQSLSELNSSRGIVAGNVVWWKNDTAIPSSSTPLTFTLSTRINGYLTTRGDLDNQIGSTNRPTYTFTGTAGSALTFSTGSARLSDFIVDTSSGAGTIGITVSGSSDIIYNVTVKNYDSIGISMGGSASQCFACEATGGTINATKGIAASASGYIYSSYVHDGNGVGIGGTSVAFIIGNIVANQAGATADCIQLTTTANAAPMILENTAYNCGRDGFSVTTTLTTPPVILANIFSNNGRYGLNFPSASPPTPFNDGNAYYNNTTANRNNADAITQSNGNPLYTRVNDVILSANPFVAAGSGNFALNATVGGGASLRNAGLPRAWPGAVTAGYPDIGAVFHQDPGTVTINANCGF